MKLPRLRTILLAPVVLFAMFYASAAIFVLFDDNAVEPLLAYTGEPRTVAIFGASGTAGDGILKAALASRDVERIHVITRRTTPRIDAGIAAGKVVMTLHLDYLDYAAIHEQIAGVDAVYWAIGTSSVGVDEETYGRIHVDFPVRFVTAWLDVSVRDEMSFHYISSSDISADSRMMWAREKVRAENSLFDLAAGTRLRVIAYRPDYIRPDARTGTSWPGSSVLVLCARECGSQGNADRPGDDRGYRAGRRVPQRRSSRNEEHHQVQRRL
jgi:hypothetical protein